MRKVLFAIAAVLVFAGPAWAGFNVYLHNGSVIKGVKAYEHKEGQVFLNYLGGIIALPSDEIYRIEEAFDIAPTGGSDTVSPSEASFFAPKAKAKKIDTGPIKRRLTSLDSRLQEIIVVEGEVQALKDEYNRVRLRIEVLFQKGRRAAIAQGGKEAEWFKFLVGQDRKWAQLNTLKKRDLKKKIEAAERDFAPLRDERNSIGTEKANLEARIKEIEGASP